MKNVFARALLATYPRAFRETHSEELTEFWVSQARERRYRGPLGGVRFVMNVGTDAVVAGLKMRWRESRKGEGMMKSMWTDLLYARRALMGAPHFSLVSRNSPWRELFMPYPGGPKQVYELFAQQHNISRGPEGIYVKPYDDRPGFGHEVSVA